MSKKHAPPAEGGSYTIGKDGKRVRDAFTEDQPVLVAKRETAAADAPAPMQPALKPADPAAKPVKGV